MLMLNGPSLSACAGLNHLFQSLVPSSSPEEAFLEEAVHVSHLHKHSLQLGVIFDCHLTVLPSDA